MNYKKMGRAAGALATVGLIGCSGSGGDAPPAQSSLSVSLMDAPVDMVSRPST